MRRVFGTAMAAVGILAFPLALPAQAAGGAIVINDKPYLDLGCIRLHGSSSKVQNYTDVIIGFWADSKCEPHERPQEILKPGATGYISKNSRLASVGYFREP
ncbi:hypothetical protein DY245_41605 [Streptomyces inhibens]|uniref:Uncharacterized protein n=1 Tax=Streptomyces inhibens TaxID=2293571 RepID=A0A371PQV0_STRIH|nr:hypothetical protein [Streptomyces inhibens]REK84729.1 hypothetical protein DY245_41605 [Streptomyces inhibens]